MCDSNLSTLINKITEFGINPNVELTDKTEVLKKLLVSIYLEFLNVEIEFDEADYDAPNFEYKEILRNVTSNFPDFGLYSTVLDSNKFKPIEIGAGDELDDFTDIIKDLLEVQWRIENTSKTDAIWHFDFFMRGHLEKHLVDLLKRLKEREE